MKFNLDDNGSNPVDEITDGQLVALAAQGYSEMKDLGRHTNQETPGTIGLLATSNVIYIASSVQGEGRGYWLGTREGQTRIDDRLLNAAHRCRIGGIHRNGGRCAELNLFDLYKARNEEIDLDGTHSRILAYGKFQNEPEKVYFPCTNYEGRWGCWTMLRALSNENPEDHLKDENLRVISPDTQPDMSWQTRWEFQNEVIRQTAGDYAACEQLSTFDPNNPEA